MICIIEEAVLKGALGLLYTTTPGLADWLEAEGPIIRAKPDKRIVVPVYDRRFGMLSIPAFVFQTECGKFCLIEALVTVEEQE